MTSRDFACHTDVYDNMTGYAVIAGDTNRSTMDKCNLSVKSPHLLAIEFDFQSDKNFCCRFSWKNIYKIKFSEEMQLFNIKILHGKMQSNPS